MQRPYFFQMKEIQQKLYEIVERAIPWKLILEKM